MLRSVLRRYRAFGRNARLYLLSNTLQAVAAGAIGVLYTLFLTALGYNGAFVGLVVFVGVLGGALGILPAGPLVDRFGWKAMLIWSDVIGGVAVALQLFFPSAPVIVLTSLGVGASVAIVLVVNNPLLAANSTPQERTALFGLSNALNYLALAAGSLLGGALPRFFSRPSVQTWPVVELLRPVLVTGAVAQSYQLALLTVGALALPSILPVFLLREDRRPRPADTPAHAASRVSPRARAAELLRRGADIARGPIGRFSLSQLFLGFGAGMFVPYINLYFVHGLGVSVGRFSVVATLQTGLLALAALVSAPLSERFGKVPLIVVVQVLGLPFLIGLGISPPFAVAALLFLAHSTIANIAQSPLQVVLMEAVPKTSRGLASEVYNGSNQGAWGIGALVGGALITLGGYGLPFFVAGGAYVISIALLASWFWPTRAHPVSDTPPPAEVPRAGIRAGADGEDL